VFEIPDCGKSVRVAYVCINVDENVSFQIGQVLHGFPGAAEPGKGLSLVFVCVCFDIGNFNVVDKALACMVNQATKTFTGMCSIAMKSLWASKQSNIWVDVSIKNKLAAALVDKSSKHSSYIYLYLIFGRYTPITPCFCTDFSTPSLRKPPLSIATQNDKIISMPCSDKKEPEGEPASRKKQKVVSETRTLVSPDVDSPDHESLLDRSIMLSVS
jgi:hypothetical protein